MENTELKTLKNIKIEGSNGRIRLRAEAVKWMKSERVKHMNGMDVLLVFFNLTDEELK